MAPGPAAHGAQSQGLDLRGPLRTRHDPGTENRHVPPAQVIEAGGSPGKLFLPCAHGQACRVERSSGPARAGSNHHEQVCLVTAENGISIGSDTRACFLLPPSPHESFHPVCLTRSRCNLADGCSYLLISGDTGVFACSRLRGG